MNSTSSNLDLLTIPFMPPVDASWTNLFPTKNEHTENVGQNICEELPR